MRISEARAILKEYMVRMDLVEWGVSLRWGTAAEMDGVDGLCVWSPEYAHAEIRLQGNMSRSDFKKALKELE